MIKIINKFYTNLLYAVLLSMLLIGIDFIADYFLGNFFIISKRFPEQILLTFLLSFTISFLYRKLRIFMTILFISFSLIEVGYFAFFRSYIESYHFGLIFTEFRDIIDSMASIKIELTILSIVFTIIIYILYRYRDLKLIVSKRVTIFFTLFLLLIPIYAYIRPNIFLTSPIRLSYLNMTYSISLFIKDIFSPKKEKLYKPYIIEKKERKIKNVILIIGESLSYKYMELFNSKYNNNPYLRKLKRDSRFSYSRAVSSGVNTPVSIFSLLKIKREPDNEEIIYRDKTNILKLARDNGYQTYWLSTQEEGASISSIIKFANIIKTRRDFREPVFDDTLLDEVEKIDFSKNSFIVLHLRANHSPYERYTPKRFISGDYSKEEYQKYKMDTYQDSIRYIDYILYNIFKKIEKKSSEFVIYFVSDHGERLGTKSDNFKYGHSELDMECAKVPLLIYSNQNIKTPKQITTHYYISKMVADSIGYRVINPNEDNKHFYLNGVSNDGSRGFIKYNILTITNLF